jgi:ribosomal-protein-alanine N-acetyltransferase
VVNGPIPSIITRRLVLRGFRPEDVDAYFHTIHDDPEVMRFLPGGQPRPRERSEFLVNWALERWRQHNFGLWALCDNASGKLIGHCGLMVIPETSGEVEVAYAIGKEWWGQGLASEAAHASLRFGFEQAGLEEIVAVADPANTASLRVMAKIGMARQGLTRQYYSGWELELYRITKELFMPGDAPYRVNPE